MADDYGQAVAAVSPFSLFDPMVQALRRQFNKPHQANLHPPGQNTGFLGAGADYQPGGVGYGTYEGNIRTPANPSGTITPNLGAANPPPLPRPRPPGLGAQPLGMAPPDPFANAPPGQVGALTMGGPSVGQPPYGQGGGWPGTSPLSPAPAGPQPQPPGGMPRGIGQPPPFMPSGMGRGGPMQGWSQPYFQPPGLPGSSMGPQSYGPPQGSPMMNALFSSMPFAMGG